MKNHQFLVYHDLALNNDGEQSITLEEDAVLPCGQILHKAGTKVNPLEHLVGGSALKLKEELDKEHVDKVYFDQAGELTTKFDIKASPAIAWQEDFRIRIEEIKLLHKEERNVDQLNKSKN